MKKKIKLRWWGGVGGWGNWIRKKKRGTAWPQCCAGFDGVQGDMAPRLGTWNKSWWRQWGESGADALETHIFRHWDMARSGSGEINIPVAVLRATPRYCSLLPSPTSPLFQRAQRPVVTQLVRPPFQRTQRILKKQKMSPDDRPPAAPPSAAVPRLAPAPAIVKRAVVYKSSALARAAPHLSSASVSNCAAISAAHATAEGVREAFKAEQDAAAVPAAAAGDNDDRANAIRHKRRVALNRNSAASSRLRKEAYVSALEAQLAALEKAYVTMYEERGARSDHDAQCFAPPPLGVVVEMAARASAPKVDDVRQDLVRRQPKPEVGALPPPVQVEPPEAAKVAPVEPPGVAAAAPVEPPELPVLPAQAQAQAENGCVAAIPGIEDLNIPALPFVDELAYLDPELCADIASLSSAALEQPQQPTYNLPEPLSDALLATYYGFDDLD